MPGRVLAGISGWRYEPWRGVFYPKDLPQSRELEYASRRLPTIEINGTFYRLQKPAFFKKWSEAVPDNFVFSVKGSRYITHLRRLKEVEEPLARFFGSGLLSLGPKLGPILWQFPPNFKFDHARMAAFFDLLPTTAAQAASLARKHKALQPGGQPIQDHPLRHAVEIRHESFQDPAYLRLLRKHELAFVTADTAGKWPLVEEPTAGFMYLRLHGDVKLYVSGYTDAALDSWAAKIKRWSKDKDVYCYFDNDVKVKAPYDAMKLNEMLGLGVKPEEEGVRTGLKKGRAPKEGLGPRASRRRPTSA